MSEGIRPNWRKYDSQETDNREHDDSLGIKKVIPYGQAGNRVAGADGSAIANFAEQLALKITYSGAISYFAWAFPGSAESDAVWAAMKMDESSGLKCTWAGGLPLFNQTATDLTSLSYS